MKLFLIINLLTLLLLLLPTTPKFSFALNELRSPSYYKCIKPSTDGTIKILLTYDKDEVEETHLESIKNAVEAGMTVEIVIIPYRCRTVEEEIAFLSSYVDISVVKRFWVALESYNAICSWKKFSPEENCRYLQELIKKWKEVNVQVQIVLFDGDWQYAFNDPTGCPEPSTTSLLWWFEQIDYSPVGGWKTPYMKFLSLTSLCGQEIYVQQIIE